MRTWQRLERWDCLASEQFNRVNQHRIGSFFSIVSRLGDGWIWMALVLVLPMMFGVRAGLVSLAMLANGAACTLLYKAMKHQFHRPRPCEVNEHIHLTEQPLDRFSFPSGHTLHAVSFSLIASSCCAGLGWPLWSFTLLVALSRLVLGLHYVSDVIMGAAIGVGMGYATLALLGQFGIPA